MATCTRNPGHIYPDHNKSCPWCAQTATAATQQTALPPIPAPPAMKSTAPPKAPTPHPFTTQAAKRAAQAAPAPIPYVPKPTRRFANRTFVVWLVTSVTVLVPWLIGSKMLRDTLWRPQGTWLTNTSTREPGDYFTNDYLAGLTVITLLAAVVLLVSGLRNPRRRAGRLITAIALAALATFAIIPEVGPQWRGAELATAARNNTTVRDPVCDDSPNGAPTADFVGDEGMGHTWTAASFGPRSFGSSGPCTSIEVWDGITYVATTTTPELYRNSVHVHPGATPADTWVSFAARGPATDTCSGQQCLTQYDILGAFPLTSTTGTPAWTVNTKLTPENNYSQDVHIAGRGALLFTLDQPGQPAGAVAAFVTATGQPAWRASCPADNPLPTDLTQEPDGVIRVRCEGNQRPWFIVNDDGSLTRDDAYTG